jgi:hypothetical protein
MHRDLGDFRLIYAAAEAAAEVTRPDRRAVASGEHQAGIDPGFPRTGAVGFLLVPAEPERSDAQIGQGDGIADRDDRAEWRAYRASRHRRLSPAADGQPSRCVVRGSNVRSTSNLGYLTGPTGDNRGGAFWGAEHR